MKLTREDLNSRWISNVTREYFTDNPELLDREIFELCDQGLLTAEVAGNLLFEITPSKWEEAALEEAAFIHSSEGIYRSFFIKNSADIDESHSVEDSSYVKYSEKVYNSINVSESSNVYCSANVYRSKSISDSRNIYCSSNIENSNYIINMKYGEHNYFVSGGNHIKNCIFCRFDFLTEEARNCALSTMNLGEYTILNHEVNETVYSHFMDTFQYLIRRFPIDELTISRAENLNPINVFSCFSNMALWRNILAILPFEITHEDLVTLYSITFIPDFLNMKI